MAKSYNVAKEEIINQVSNEVKNKFPSQSAELMIKFFENYVNSAAPEDIASRAWQDLYGALVSHWHFLNTRKNSSPKVRVYNPQYEQHGWQSTHTVVEVIYDDVPFLLESIRMVLNRHGFSAHMILHTGDCKIARDSNGAIIDIQLESTKSVKSATTTEQKLVEESPIFIEIDKQSDENILEKLEAEIVSCVDDVSLAVADWKKMKGRMQDLVKELEDKKVPKEVKNKQDIIEFLKWLNNNHFTYLGYCYREIKKIKQDTKNDYEYKIKEKTALGIIKKYANNYFMRFKQLSQAAQKMALSKKMINLGKTNSRSTVHRPAFTDFISVKDFDESGNLIGEHRFVGLYTAAAYNRSPQNIPLLNEKVEAILRQAGVSKSSHDGKTLINILENLPRDDLFQATKSELHDISVGILHLQERQKIRLFVRQDPFGLFYSCLVYVPREHFNSDLREVFQEILLKELNGYQVEFTTYFSESVLARIHFIVRYKEDMAQAFDAVEIQEKLINASLTWEDNFKAALLEHYGEEEGNNLFCKYQGAFPAGYRESFTVRTAIYDISHMEKLNSDNQLEMSFYRPLEEPEGILRFKLFSPMHWVPLSDVIPMLECMGLRVVSERPHKITMQNKNTVWINDFAMLFNSDQELEVEKIKDKFQEAFCQMWYGKIESDGFNKLVLRVGLNWREVAMLRAYAKYMWQIGFTFSQAYIEEVLAEKPHITKEIVKLFTLRFDPNITIRDRTFECDTIRNNIKKLLEEVSNLDEDRILQKFVDVILGTIRTNFYQLDANEHGKDYISFKFVPSKIPEMPRPRPMYEIFVYSPRVEGVHLRGAKVARGGLRWSDRREDFRTEVLGLMKAQQVKNAVIVPLGAKGGFVPKLLPTNGTREEINQEAIECYKTFIRGLLDITDNLQDDKVVSPANVVRYDEDDTYLVVAADKGTATFSDIANGISREYNFWLDDAFASGGSTGYDHKKMGITARGAWESVKRNFRELGIDTQHQDFTVVGIGDMSGDVFGNGMLLSNHIKLIAAFNHMHIFLDPNPDAATSFKERERLFNLPRSTWDDYDKKLISKGGGVFLRSVKYIPISKEVQKALNIKQDHLVPNDLIRAILQSKVDLLWNGGIGTYVKASSEHNSEVGDRANDSIRINGKELNCKVVGEGGNLGFTQLGRVEFALKDGKINTDAIDNSGGVDCSDHEVNIKILLNSVVSHGDMTEKQRNELLENMTDEVAELVLDNNRSQTEALSVAEFNSNKNAQMHCRLIEHLEKNTNLDRELEFLPTNEQLLARQQTGKGLSRPELSVLLAYSKTLLKQELLDSNVPEDQFIIKDLLTAFPSILLEKYQTELFNHRLKRELVAMQVTNRVVNEMGLGFIHRLQDETGAGAPDIIRAYVAAREIFKAKAFREGVNALDFIVSAKVQVKMLHELNRLIRRATRWFLRHRVGNIEVAKTIENFAPKVKLVREGIKESLRGKAIEYLNEYANELIAQKVPEEIAVATAQMSAMFSALDIVDASSENDLPVDDVIQTYYCVGSKLELGWVREQIKQQPVASHWDALARSAIRDDLDRQQRNLTVSILRSKFEVSELEEQVDSWLEHHKILVNRWREMVKDLKALSKRDFTMYSVALRELVELSNIGAMECDKIKVA